MMLLQLAHSMLYSVLSAVAQGQLVKAVILGSGVPFVPLEAGYNLLCHKSAVHGA